MKKIFFTLIMCICFISLCSCQILNGLTGGETGDETEGADDMTKITVASVEKTKTDGNTDTYTITFSDGSTTTFTINNAAEGGENPNNNEDGSDNNEGSSDKNEDSAADSVISVTKTGSEGDIDTYAITFADGSSTTFTITNETEEVWTPTGEVLAVKDGRGGIAVLIHDDGQTGKMTPQNLDELNRKYGLVTDVALLASYIKTDDVPDASKVQYWQNYLDTGRWKIVSHSMTHTRWFERVSNGDGTYSYVIDEAKMKDEIVGSAELFRELFPGQRVLTFAYPGLSTEKNWVGNDVEAILEHIYSPEARSLIDDTYISGRWGSVVPIPAVDDTDTPWTHIGAYHVDTEFLTSGDGSATLAATAEDGLLTVYYAHAVLTGTGTDRTSLDEMDKFYAEIAEQVKDGRIWNTHYEDAVLYVREAQTARVIFSAQAESCISFRVTDEMDDDIYNYPLSVRITVPDSWEAAKILIGDSISYAEVKVADGKRVVDISEVVPDVDEVILLPVTVDEIPAPTVPEPITSINTSFNFEEDSESIIVNGVKKEIITTAGAVTSVLKMVKDSETYPPYLKLKALDNAICAEAISLTFRIKLPKPEDATRGSQIMNIMLNEGPETTPYIISFNLMEDGFKLGDKTKSTNSSLITVMSGMLEYDVWHDIRLDIVINGENGFLATMYTNGDVYTSTNFANQTGAEDAAASGSVSQMRFTFLKAAIITLYLEDVTLKAGTVEQAGIWSGAPTDGVDPNGSAITSISVNELEETITTNGTTTSIVAVEDAAGDVLKIEKTSQDRLSISKDLTDTPISVDAFSVTFRIKISNPLPFAYPEHLMHIRFGDDTPYIMSFSFRDEGFCFGDKASTSKTVLKTTTSGLLSYDTWYDFRLDVVINGENGFLATTYVNGETYTSTVFANQSGAEDATPVNTVSGIRIGFYSTSAITLYLDHMTLKAGTVEEAALWESAPWDDAGKNAATE